MDQGAIDRLLQLTNSINQPELVTHTPVIRLFEKVRLESLEPFLQRPVQMRQLYAARRIDSFIDYVADNMTATSVGYLNIENGTARVVIDHGTHEAPEWGKHTAKLGLEHTEAFQALESACSRKLSQQALIEFLEDWALPGVVQCFDEDNEEIEPRKAIAMIRRVVIAKKSDSEHSQGSFSASRSAIESIEANANERKVASLMLVDPVYVSHNENVDVTAKLYLTTAEDKPFFALRILGKDAMMKGLADAIRDRLRASLGVTLYDGTMTR